MGSPWLATGPYSITTKPRAPGRFLDTSRTSGTPYNIQKLQKKTEKSKNPVFFRIFELPIYRLRGLILGLKHLPTVARLGAAQSGLWLVKVWSHLARAATYHHVRNNHPHVAQDHISPHVATGRVSPHET